MLRIRLSRIVTSIGEVGWTYVLQHNDLQPLFTPSTSLLTQSAFKGFALLPKMRITVGLAFPHPIQSMQLVVLH